MAVAGGEPPIAELEGVRRLADMFPEEDERILSSFLSLKANKVDDAATQYREVKRWREEIGPVGIKDVESFLRAGDAYMVTLEYPGCEKRTHPPIIFLNGMIRGKKEEMIKQVIYCVERAWANMPPGPPRVKFVVNTRNRSFRIPDSNYRAAVFHVLRNHYPWLISCKVIFIDVPSIIAAGLTAVGKLFDKVMTDRFQLAASSQWTTADDDVQAYAEHVPASHALAWSEARVMSFDVEALILMRSEGERDKPATWEGEGGIMGSVQLFPPLPPSPPTTTTTNTPGNDNTTTIDADEIGKERKGSNSGDGGGDSAADDDTQSQLPSPPAASSSP